MVDQAELISAAQAGDRSAFDELVRQTYVDTYTLALRLSSDEEDARDVVQDAYLRAWKSIGRFRGDAAVQHLDVPDHRELRVDVRRQAPPAPHRAAPGPPRAGGPPPRVPARGACSSRAPSWTSVARARSPPSPPRLRAVVVLKDVYGLPHEAIAEELGISRVGGEGPAAPGPAAPARRARTRRRGRPVRFEDVADLLPGLVDGTVRVDERTQEFIESDLRCQAELARYRKLLRTLEQLRTRYFEPSPGLLAADARGARRGGRAPGGPLDHHRPPPRLRRRRPRRRGRGRRRRHRGDPRPPPPSSPAEPPGRRVSGAGDRPTEILGVVLGRNEAGRSWANLDLPATRARRAVAQLVELRSPKPTVGGSSPSCPAGHQDPHQDPRISTCTTPPGTTTLERPRSVNRQTKRMMAKQGSRQAARARTQDARRAQARGAHRRRVQFLSEVRGELRKVAWPTPPRGHQLDDRRVDRGRRDGDADLRLRLRLRQGRPLPLRLRPPHD